jgi:hypothetical protein
MPFEAKDFHEFALWSVEKRTDEASFRTAVNRVYYAAHLLAVEKAQSKKSFVPKGTGEDHFGVIRALRPGATSQIANRLADLLERRFHVDYHLKTTDDVAGSCKHCEKFRQAPSSGVAVGRDLWEEAKVLADELLRRSKRCRRWNRV